VEVIPHGRRHPSFKKQKTLTLVLKEAFIKPGSFRLGGSSWTSRKNSNMWGAEVIVKLVKKKQRGALQGTISQKNTTTEGGKDIEEDLFNGKDRGGVSSK